MDIIQRNLPLLSVCMITYKHEKFIAQAIEGVLMQKTSFAIELVIADDCSPDKTSVIIAQYKLLYPEVIRVLERSSNLGMMPNFCDALLSCKGKYIAICEGDDYWTDPLKLQKQIDFLEINPDFMISFHNMLVKRYHSDDGLYNSPLQPITTTINELAVRNYIATASCVFRSRLTNFPIWFAEVPAGDYTLHMLNARYGKISYMPDIMGVYREHNQSSWQSKSDFYKVTNWFKTLAFLITEFDGIVKEQLVSSQIAALKTALADETITDVEKGSFLATHVREIQHLLSIVQPQFEQQRIKVKSLEHRIVAAFVEPLRKILNR